MQRGMNKEQAKMHACSTGLILAGLTVEDEHSMVLCERGREWHYSKKRPEQRRLAECVMETREHRG